MFSLLKKDPVKKLEKEYKNLLAKALGFQRNGDIRTYSELMSKAEEVAQKIDQHKT